MTTRVPTKADLQEWLGNVMSEPPSQDREDAANILRNAMDLHVASGNPLSTPEEVVGHETGRQKVRDFKGKPLCDWHTERAKELMGLSDQIARQTGLTDEDVPHEFQEGPTYPGRCVACERAQQANGGHPWEAPQGGGSRSSIQSDRMPYARSWPNRPRRTEPFMPLPQSMSSRVAVRRGQTPLAPGEIGLQRIAHQISADMPDVVVIKKLAHDSGDGQTIFHCFGGETRYITRDGVKTLAETVGTTQWVLTGTVDDPHGGFWLQAPVVELGEQELWEVILKRNRRKKVIRATAGHRWLVRQPDRVVTTENLKPDHRLAHLRARQFDLVPSNDGIRMGLVYGDGSIQYRDATTYGCVTLWGEKRQLGKYFDEIAVQSHETVTPNGVRGLRYTSGMKGYTKNLPGVHETPEFLLGWLMGYFAADGAVSAIGQVALSSASLEALERVRDICTTLGIGTYEPVMRMRPGYGVTPTALHTVNFMAEDLPSEFFLRDDHRNRVKVDGKPARIGWTVESVRPTGKVETVYCVRAHGTDTFTLEDNIHTGQCPFCGSGQVIATSDGGVSCEFCKASFSVQIQPQYPAFPQTIDGQPVNVPDMGPDFTPYGGTPPGEEAPMPMDGDEEDPNGGDPMGANADETEPPEEDDDESGDEGGGGNPFAKKSFVTTTGAVLSRDAYLRHLALACSPDRDVTLARLRAINGTR